jgi:hypothetical protein
VTDARNHFELHSVTRQSRRGDVLLRQRQRYKLLVLPQDQHLRNAEREQPTWRRLRVSFRHGGRRTTEKRCDHSVFAEALIAIDVGRQVDRPGKIDDASDLQRITCVERAR